jgi:hypothetical protein
MLCIHSNEQQLGGANPIYIERVLGFIEACGKEMNLDRRFWAD